ncbi:peptidase inhibitor family I36 protein [Streptomyces caniscabiei]|uniref:peptidase inhibitor family I36 protein n=1 Tax=Streptomyces caniscabiei TaxID=2746961 RepID=UPI0029BE61AD|nr:peptidase inhibitor family I36 protein [Streptomyces caniscabiei]MDX2603777.1 peptidase inhibitor family I36 protein [Streptomyces caniscabiei]MDX2738691.1 peptidase inhibitor family I36 protein [Streptomyces caniscabiei]MDX2780579.1 peptidase inhibitor family I36 protein [Streptomyces caniscabiei]
MRKFTVTAALLGLTALGVVVPAATSQAADSAVAGPGCDSKWGARNGYMYAWENLDCGGAQLIATPGNSANWGAAANDKATSVMNRGYVGSLDHVAFYENDNYGGGHACLAPGELYADNLTDNRFNTGGIVNDHITSHRWVNRSACGAFLT